MQVAGLVCAMFVFVCYDDERAAMMDQGSYQGSYQGIRFFLFFFITLRFCDRRLNFDKTVT